MQSARVKGDAPLAGASDRQRHEHGRIVGLAELQLQRRIGHHHCAEPIQRRGGVRAGDPTGVG
jgi:hypothetical protein